MQGGIAFAAAPGMATKMYREPRMTVLERPDRDAEQQQQADQLDSLLSEFLTIRSVQASLLEQPSTLKAACSLLPPCSKATGPRISCTTGPLRNDHTLAPDRAPLAGFSSPEANQQGPPPTASRLISTLSSWWT